MGHRSNTVLVESGFVSIHYSQWGALGLPALLLRGPSPTIAAIRADRTEACLQTDTWCEGAAVVDLDRRHLLWFGGIETKYLLPHRRAFFRMLASQWSGWSVAWADQGVLDIAAYI